MSVATRKTAWLAGVMAATVGSTAARLHAQEATNTPAATQPSVGAWYLREVVRYIRLGDDPSPADRDVHVIEAVTSLTFGVLKNLSATLDLPLEYKREVAEATGTNDREAGAGDAALSLKWRPLQWDLSPIDSVRVAVIAGIETPTGSGDLGSHSWDPFGGAVLTAIIGRHGFNQAVRYKFNQGGDRFNTRAGDGPDDALRYDSAYLFRLLPEEYGESSVAATYLTVELNGLYETNGDHEVLFGPGILYEGRSFALEASFGLPVVSDVRERPQTELVVSLGLRLLF